MPAAEDEESLDHGVTVLAITRDEALCDALRDAMSVWKWTVHRQTEACSAAAGVSLSTYSLVIYDSDVTNGSWKDALMEISAAGGDPCILLASPVNDPYLRNEVVRCGGFDVLAKQASREQITKTLRFAWFWKKSSQHRRGASRP